MYRMCRIPEKFKYMGTPLENVTSYFASIVINLTTYISIVKVTIYRQSHLPATLKTFSITENCSKKTFPEDLKITFPEVSLS